MKCAKIGALLSDVPLVREKNERKNVK